MTHVVTLIGNPYNRLDFNQLISEVSVNLENYSSSIQLADGIALDLRFVPDPNFDQSKLTSSLKKKFENFPVDLVIQNETARRKKLLVADMDSTMIRQECIDELADELGIKEHISNITARTMRGELEFETSLRERVALLKGLPITAVDKIITSRIELTPGATTLVKTMKKSGAYCSLVSGGFTVFTEVISKMIGFNENIANKLAVENEILTGKVIDPIVGMETKQNRLNQLLGKLNIDVSESIAVGDGANDLAMLKSAGLGVAFHAKPKVASMADVSIEHGDLTALLYIQGYRQDEFVN